MSETGNGDNPCEGYEKYDFDLDSIRAMDRETAISILRRVFYGNFYFVADLIEEGNVATTLLALVDAAGKPMPDCLRKASDIGERDELSIPENLSMSDKLLYEFGRFEMGASKMVVVAMIIASNPLLSARFECIAESANEEGERERDAMLVEVNQFCEAESLLLREIGKEAFFAMSEEVREVLVEARKRVLEETEESN